MTTIAAIAGDYGVFLKWKPFGLLDYLWKTPGNFFGQLFCIGSGIMEGINNKIGRVTRMAYGYRDIDFLHLRI